MTKELNGMDVEAPVTAPVIDIEAGRRAFVKNLGMGALGTAVFAATGMSGETAQAAVTFSDGDILNFALNLEYLEASFYLAAIGKTLPAALMGSNPGQTSGGKKVPFKSPIVKAYADEIAEDEEDHVKFLRAGLGEAAVAKPALNIGTAFAMAADAAGITTDGSFDAYANDTNFLLAAYIFEDVGVTAYHGAAKLLQSKTFLDYAAGILAVEAYHAGLIRTVLFAMQDPTVSKYAEQISALRASLSNANDDFGPGFGTKSTIVLSDSNALAFGRSFRQVLNVVYGKKNASQGLFFPAGVHGKINGPNTKGEPNYVDGVAPQ